MQKGTFGKAMRYLVVVGTLVSALALVACGGDDEKDVDVSIPLNNGTVVAVQNQPFNIPSQVFNTSGTVTLTFTNVNTFTLIGSGGGAATGVVTYSSCTFDVRVPGGLIPTAVVITIPTCNLLVDATGVEEGGDEVGGTVALEFSGAFGTVTSNTVAARVFLNDDGELFVVNPVTGAEVNMGIEP
jgi:hypothetical protein